MKKTFVLVALCMALLWSLPARAQSRHGCEDEAGNPVPCEKPPEDGGGGGGGGGLCWTQSCARCAMTCSEFGGCWNICDYVTANAGCACWFESGSCSENGTCTYVP
jgi:hypothetical protein